MRHELGQMIFEVRRSTMTLVGYSRFEIEDPRPARLGDVQVPRAVAWKITGERGAPDARIDFEVRNGKIVCTRVLITAGQGRPDAAGLRSTDVAGFDLEAMGAAAIAYAADPRQPREPDRLMMFRSLPVALDLGSGETPIEQMAGMRAHALPDARAEPLPKTRSRRPRGGTPDDQLRAIAETYKKWPAAPIQAVMQQFDLSRRTAHRRVAEARARGLLAPLGSA